MKTWPIIFVCLNAGAVHIELAKAYSTKAFLTKLEAFISIRGCPSFMYSDLGSNIVKAGKVTSQDDDALPWEQIKKETSYMGIEWHHAPSQAQFRDGATESCVKMLKHTLKHLLKGGPLDYDEFDCVLKKAANILNERPLSIRVHSGADPEFCPVTPNLIMMGQRTRSNLKDHYSLKKNSHYTERVRLMEECYQHWWDMWSSQVFPQLVPVPKWRQEVRNMEIGDIVSVQFSSKFSSPRFRMGVVKEVKFDSKGLVRSCMVAMRPKNARESSLPYKSKELLVQEIVVQRLVVYLPIEDQEVVDPVPQGVLEKEVPHVCPDAANVNHQAGVPLQLPLSEVAEYNNRVNAEADHSEGDHNRGDDDVNPQEAVQVNAVVRRDPTPSPHHESPDSLPWVPSFTESSMSYLRDSPVPSSSMCPKVLLQIWS